jgi:hypothetical protein
MFKVTTVVLFFMLSTLCFAQEIDRFEINGKISAPQGEDIENVNVYNISSQLGTASNKDGEFTLEVAENDRIQITALQFQSFTVIVDKGVIDKKRMAIYLNPAVNQLEEVIVRPYDLSGNIIADLNRIKTSTLNPGWDTSYTTLEFGYEFSDDQYSSIDGNKAEEAFYNGQKQAGLNFVGMGNLLFSKKRKTETSKIANKEVIIRALRQRFSNAYISEEFNIKDKNVNDFIYFLEESGIDQNLLLAKNELLLLDFLNRQSTLYKQQFGED